MPRPFAIIGLMVFFVLASLYDASSETVIIVFLAFVLLLLISVIVRKFRKETGIQAMLASGAIACLLLLCVNELWYAPQVRLADSAYDSVILITSEPERKYGNYYYEAKATQIAGNKTNVNVRLTFFSKPDISPYDEIEGSFYYYRLGTSSESLLSSYKSENRFLGAYTADGEYNITKTGSHKFGRLIISLRSGIRDGIMTVLPNDYGALATALVLGDKSQLSDEAYAAVKNAGVSHIICVSGLHLSLWSSAILWLLKKLKIKEKYACLISVPFVLFIMVLTGMTNSVVRAGIMMILYLLSKVFSQRNDSLNSLGISILVISCINPYAAGSVSLQLSMLATLGVILGNEYVMPYIDKFGGKHSWFVFAEKPVKLLAVTASAVFFTAPVTLTVYRSFTLVSFLSNLLIVSIAEVCMMTAALGAVIAFFSTSILNIPAFIAGVLAKCILKIASIIGGMNFGKAYVSENDAYLIITFVFAASAVFLTLYRLGKRRAKAAIIIIPVAFLITVFSFSYIDSLQTEIRVLDIDGGKNVFISYRNENMLIGCSGTDKSGIYDIENAAERNGGKIDSVIICRSTGFNVSYLRTVMGRYDPPVIFCDDADFSTKLLLSESYTDDAEKCSTGNIRITEINDKDGNKAIVAETKELKTIIFLESIDISSLDYDISDSDIVVICSDEIPAARFTGLSSVIVCTDGETGSQLQSSLMLSGINAFVTAGYGDVTAYGYKDRITIERG